MIRGLFDAAAGMSARIAIQDVIANNLANIGTNGFQREVAAVRMRLVPGHGFGLQGTSSHEFLESHATADTHAGALQQTGAPGDLAMDGDGYLVIQAAQGQRLIRGGSLHTDAQGNLATPTGEQVLSTDNKPISVGKLPWQVAQDGTVNAGGKAVGRLRIVTPDGPVQREGNSLVASGAIKDVPAGKTRLLQGYVEKSNVEPVREMVDMIAGMRAYEANQRSIVAQDQTLEKLFGVLSR